MQAQGGGGGAGRGGVGGWAGARIPRYKYFHVSSEASNCPVLSVSNHIPEHATTPVFDFSIRKNCRPYGTSHAPEPQGAVLILRKKEIKPTAGPPGLKIGKESNHISPFGELKARYVPSIGTPSLNTPLFCEHVPPRRRGEDSAIRREDIGHKTNAQ